MILYHQDLLGVLPDKELQNQYVNIRKLVKARLNDRYIYLDEKQKYINNYSLNHLYAYGLLLADKLRNKKVAFNMKFIKQYSTLKALDIYAGVLLRERKIFLEHNEKYYRFSVNILTKKGLLTENKGDMLKWN